MPDHVRDLSPTPERPSHERATLPQDGLIDPAVTEGAEGRSEPDRSVDGAPALRNRLPAGTDWATVTAQAQQRLEKRRKKKRKWDDEALALLKHGWTTVLNRLPVDRQERLAEFAQRSLDRSAEADRLRHIPTRDDRDQAALRQAAAGQRSAEAALVREVIDAARRAAELSAELAVEHGLDSSVHRRRIKHPDHPATAERVRERNATLDRVVTGWLASCESDVPHFRFGSYRHPLPDQLPHVEIAASTDLERASSWQDIGRQLYEAGERVERITGRTKAISHEVISVQAEDSGNISPSSAVEMFKAYDVITGRDPLVSVTVVHRPHGDEPHWHAHRISVAFERPIHSKVCAALVTRLGEHLAYGRGRISAAASTRRDVTDGYRSIQEEGALETVRYDRVSGQRYVVKRPMEEIGLDMLLLASAPVVTQRGGKRVGAILSPKPSMRAADVGALVWHVIGSN